MSLTASVFDDESISSQMYPFSRHNWLFASVRTACATLADDVSADVAADVIDCVASDVINDLASDVIDDVAADAAGDVADDVILSNRHKLHLEIDTDQALNLTQNTLSIVTDLPSLWSQKCR